MTSLTVVLGADPAGLTAAYELAKNDHPVVVVESARAVGGRSRCETYQNCLIDVGGHRFTTRLPEIQSLWAALLEEPLVSVPELSRVVYRHRFFDYPLSLTNALKNMGPGDSALIALSYLKAQTHRSTHEASAKTWLSERFGAHFQRTFFQPYFEKILGLPTCDIDADWVARKLKGMSLSQALAVAAGQRSGEPKADFDYPLRGPGEVWQRCHRLLTELGTPVYTETRVVKIEHSQGRVTCVKVAAGADNAKREDDLETRGNVSLADGQPDDRQSNDRQLEDVQTVECDRLISTLPMAELIAQLDPPPPVAVRRAAAALKFRSLLSVPLVLNVAEVFPDTQLHIHSPALKVGRIQNFKNWSAAMVPNPAQTCLGFEYFCMQGDDLWAMEDAALVRLACKEAIALGFVPNTDAIVGGCVIRHPNAYPLHHQAYYKPLAIVQNYLESFENLQAAGCRGLHCDVEHDYSALTGYQAARNILGAGARVPISSALEASVQATHRYQDRYRQNGVSIPPEEAIRFF
ncbi:MAG: FAD-dependent oxidoreductase [Cyanobacteria bacterium J06635_11]